MQQKPPLDLPSLAHPQLPSFEDDEQEYVHRPGPRPRPGHTAHTRLLSGAAAPLHVTLRSGGVPPRFTGASWHRWLPAGYCGKLLLATAASWLIQQNLTGSVSLFYHFTRFNNSAATAAGHYVCEEIMAMSVIM